MTQMKIRAAGLIALLSLFMVGEATAAVCTSLSTGRWDQVARWSCGHIPVAADTVVIAHNNVQMRGNYTVAGITINAAAVLDGNNKNLTVSGPVLISGTFSTGGGNLTTTGTGSLTVDTGGTFDFNNGNAAIVGNVVINGTLTSGGDAIQMTGANTTVSGTGTIDNTDFEIDALGISQPVGSTLAFSNGAQLRVGNNNTASFILNGTITGFGMAAGDRIVRVYQNSGMTINGTINAPNAYIRMEQNAAITNNGTVSVQYLRTDAATSVWTQGNDSNLTLSANAPAGDWNGVLNASATGNTVTFDGTSIPFNPLTYYNLDGVGVTCPHPAGITVLGTSPCTLPLTPIAEYRMDEASWNGTANEAVDSSASGFHGTAAGLTTKPTTSNASPAIAGSPGTCRYGVFNRSNKDYLSLPSFPNLAAAAGSFAITAWINVADNTLPGQRIFIDDQTNSSPGGWGFSVGETTAFGVGGLRFYYRQPSVYILDTVAIPSNQWLFVALSVRLAAGANASSATIYAYNTAGTLVASNTGTFTWTAGSDPGPSSIGGETNASGEGTNAFGFGGNLDEVRVYQTALSQAQVAAIATEAHVCTVVGPDHIEIKHDGNGLTCSLDTVTITACANAACTAPHYSGGVNVTLTPGGQVFAIDTTGVNSTATVQQSTVGAATLGATSTATNAATCWNTATSTASCAMTFSDSGFIVTVPDRTSCSSATATIEAVQTAPGTGRCVPAYQNASHAVNLKCAYASPATGTLPVIAAGVALNSTNTANAACDGTGQSPTLSFDANGTATISLSYPDAGQLTLTADGTAPTGKVMTGSSVFVVAPASFAFSGIPAAPLTAGQAFNATVTAMNACATPAATPNFNGTVTLTSSNPQPGLGNATAINASLSGFSNGAASTNLIWNEVGTIDMNASMSSYLGWTLPAAVTGFQAGVGRFQPAYFDTTVTPGCATFTYAGTTTPAKAGQSFTVTVTAKRFGGDATPATNTANYAGAANAYLTTLSNAGVVTGLANNTILAADFANGVGSANVTYEVAIPETAPLTLSMRATNADPTPVSSLGHAEGAANIRSGRAKLSNAHGSELLGLPVPFRAQYWSGNGWVTNSADTCSGDVTLEAGNAVSVALSASPVTCVQDSASPGLSGAGCAFAGPTGQRFKEGATPSIGFMGDFNLWLKAPGAGNVGAVTVTGNVPTWLQFAWGGGVVSNPTARATFGVYKGNNEFIYLRENY